MCLVIERFSDNGEDLIKWNKKKTDHELLIAKFRLKLKKVGKTTRPFRDDLNQIPYNYTVEVRNRFKGLDLRDRVPEKTMDGGLWHCTGGRDQDHPQEKEMQKGKMFVWVDLKIAVKRGEVKGKEEKKDIHYHMTAEFQRIARRDKKAFLSD